MISIIQEFKSMEINFGEKNLRHSIIQHNNSHIRFQMPSI